MGQNSIRDNMSKSDIISEIRLTISSAPKHSIHSIIVEGKDDVLFFKNIVTENSYIYESFSGKNGVREIVSHLNHQNVIGVCDTDYDFDYSHELIHHYDYSCLEIMILSNNKVFEKMTNNFYFGNLSYSDLRFKILKDLRFISCLRKYNHDSKKMINFNGLVLKKVFSGKESALSNELIKKELRKINNDYSDEFTSIINIAECISDKYNDYIELLKITNGHDFITYFQLLCNIAKHRYSRELNKLELISSLRLLFDINEFAKTALFAELKKHEERCKSSILLCQSQ